MNVFVRSVPLVVLTAVCFFGVQPCRAQTSVTTNPVGYVQLTCTAASDTVVSVPFTQQPAYVGTVATVSGSLVTVSSTTGWSNNQFVYSGSGSSTYYALLGPASTGTDPKDGSYYTVSANGTNTLTLALNGDNISSVPATSAVSIIPYWTYGTVFPPSASGTSFIASTSPLVRATQIFVPNYSGSGDYLSAAATYYFYNGAWRLVGDSASNSHNDDILIPDGYITLRNSDASTTLTLTAMGNVLTGNQMIPLATETSTPQDNSVAICRPVDTSLNNLGLVVNGGTGGAFTPSTSSLVRQDQIFVVSNTAVGLYKSTTATYFYYIGTSGTGWRMVGDSLANDHGNDVISAGTGFILRKAPTSNGATAFWQNSPSY